MAYDLVFNNPHGPRISSSYDKWNLRDAAWLDYSVDQAKEMSHRQLTLSNAMDAASLRNVYDPLQQNDESPLAPDTSDDSHSPDEHNETSSSATSTPSVHPPASSLIIRTGSTSPGASSSVEDSPLLVKPACGERACSRPGTSRMFPGEGRCGRFLHGDCGVVVSRSCASRFGGRKCSSCSKRRVSRTFPMRSNFTFFPLL